MALQSLGHPDEASEIYQRILERNPDSEESLSNLILIGMAKEDFDMVREYSERLLELHPESTVALEGLAAWACAAGEHALTAKFCTLLVTAVPGHFEGWFNLALAHQKSGRFEQAAEAYEECIKLRAAILRSAHQSGNRARAARRYCRRARGVRARDQGGPGSAGAALEHGAAAGALRPVRRGGTLVQAGSGARAEGRGGAVPDGLSCACSAKIIRGAAEAFEGCLKYRPAWPEAHANLALAYSGLGERDHAERLYEKMLDARSEVAWMRCAAWRRCRFRPTISIPRWNSTCA